ncbi:MAG: DUF3786 domain-containing protein [Planctomycetes bacterium]|nr:DUF3786 domain-containing protein [Planctomycetota bacterium]
MHEKLYKQLIKADSQQVAQNAQCQFDAAGNQYKLKFLNTDYIIDIDQQCIIPAEEGAQGGNPGFLHQLCMLAYLIKAKDIPLTGRLVTADKLDGGQFFFRSPHQLPTKRLEDAFGTCPDLLYTAAGPLNPQKCEFGDASVRFLAFPNVPVHFIVWAADDQFPARASILYDRTADQQLPLDAIWSTTNIAVKSITT